MSETDRGVLSSCFQKYKCDGGGGSEVCVWVGVRKCFVCFRVSFTGLQVSERIDKRYNHCFVNLLVFIFFLFLSFSET